VFRSFHFLGLSYQANLFSLYKINDQSSLSLHSDEFNHWNEDRSFWFDRIFRMDCRSCLIKEERIFILYYKIMNLILGYIFSFLFLHSRKCKQILFEYYNYLVPTNCNSSTSFPFSFVQNFICLGRGPGGTRIFVRNFWINCRFHQGKCSNIIDWRRRNFLQIQNITLANYPQPQRNCVILMC
jgi:hypothetical protein